MTTGPADQAAIEGRCTCGHVRYRLKREPMWVNCCHCTWCQRETGAAFAVNALVETGELELLQGDVEVVETPTADGRGAQAQMICRCPRCRVALWSHYRTAGDAVAYVRVGTLDEPGRCVPDAHIFTASRLPWVTLPEGALAVPGHYDRAEVWSAAAYARFVAALATRSGG